MNHFVNFFQGIFPEMNQKEEKDEYMTDSFHSNELKVNQEGKLFRVLGGCVPPIPMTYLIPFLYGSSDLATVK